MAESREITRQHYDAHAAGQQHLSTSQVLKNRSSGPAYDLKRFHNDIKRDLIYRFAYQAGSLIDYACGRGGDIHKWHASKIKYIKGLDISGVEIEEARRRFRELQESRRAGYMQADFEQIDTLGLQVLEEQRQYDVATCMFALHYFFDQPDSLKTLLKTIAGNLKPGGYFLGCVPDGKRIKAHLRAKGADGKEVVRDLAKEHLILKKTNEGWDTFGSRYIMQIPDTVVGAVEGLTEGSEEFLVFDKVLLAEAARVGLHPVVLYEDPKLDQLFEEKDKDKPMKHFNPQYPEYGDGSLSLASQLYMAFVFQKVDNPAAVKAPPLPPPPQDGRQRGAAPAAAAGGGGGEGGPGAAAAGGGRGPWGGRGGGRGGGGQSKLDSLSWQLPYAATTLRPEDLPSAYHNMRHNNLKNRSQQLHRWILFQPPLPDYPGPVRYDQHMAPMFHLLPDKTPVEDYAVELNYHAWQQRQRQQQAAAQGHFPPPPPEPQQQQQQQGPPTSRGHSVNDMHSQQQQQGPQISRAPDPASSAAAAAAGGSGPPEAPVRGRGRGGRGGGRGRAPGSTAAAAAGDEPGGSTGRGRGRGRGRAAGSKRERAADSAADAGAAAQGSGPDADDEPLAAKKQAKGTAAAAVAAGPGGSAAPAAAAAGSGTVHAAGAADGVAGPGGAAAAAARAATAGAGGSDRTSARLQKIQAADPLGYKEQQQPAPLPPEFWAEMMQHAPAYAEEPADEGGDS